MSLDIPERQVLVRFPNDLIEWHHRVLLRQIAGSQWVVVTPDLDIEVIDLGNFTIRALRRSADYPDGIGQVYGFDDIEEPALNELRAEARNMAAVLGADVGPAPPGLGEPAAVWLYADPGHDKFDETVSDEVMGHGETVVKGSLAIIFSAEATGYDGEITFTMAQRVREADRASWLDNKRAGAGRDPRLAKPRRDHEGKPRAFLNDSLGDTKIVKMVGWPFEGPSAVVEYAKSVNAAGHQFNTFQAHWVKASGVNADSAVAIEHGLNLTYLFLLQSFDQLALSNCAAAEQIARRLLMTERAVRKSPRSPDFTGLSVYLSNTLDDSGGVVASAFDKHVSGLKQSEAFILKQERLWKDEQEAETKRQRDRGNHGGGDGNGKKDKKGGQDGRPDK